jgi:tetratricopeptide (TPR) repeat protein
MGDFERGFSLLYSLIRENMVPSRVPEIYNEMARYYEVTAVYNRQAGITGEGEDYQKAIDYYKKSVDYPNSDDTKAKSYAQFQVGELEMKLNKYDDAAMAYQATIYRFSGTEWAQLAEQRMDQLRQEGKTSVSPLKKSAQKPNIPETEKMEEVMQNKAESEDNQNQETESPE